jgi:hypothetical protein
MFASLRRLLLPVKVFHLLGVLAMLRCCCGVDVALCCAARHAAASLGVAAQGAKSQLGGRST